MENNGVVVTKIEAEFIRLDALLKLSGAFETGGRAKVAIQGGEVLVNGEVCRMRGKKMRPGDTAVFGGKTYGVAAGREPSAGSRPPVR